LVSPHNLLPLPVTRNTATRLAYDMRQSLMFSEASSFCTRRYLSKNLTLTI